MLRLPTIADLVPRIEEHLAAADGAPVWVLVPSAGLVHETEHALLDAGVSAAQLFVMTPRVAVQRVLADRGIVPPRAISRSALLAWLERETREARARQPLFLRDETEYLLRFPATRRTLLATLRRLRLLETAYRARAQTATHRAGLYHGFLAPLEAALERAGAGDAATRLGLAMRALREPHATDPRAVVVLATGPYDDPELAGLARSLCGRVAFDCLAPVRHDRNGRRPFDDVPATQLHTFSAQGEEAELTEVARRARAAIAAGTQPHRIAVIPVHLASYEYLIAPVFAREDVPVALRGTRPLAATPLGLLARRLVTLACHDVPRRTLIEVMSDPAAQPALARADVADIDFRTRDEGCLGGSQALRETAGRWLAPWLDALDTARSRLDRAKTARRQAECLTGFLRAHVTSDDVAVDLVLAQIQRLGEHTQLGLGPVPCERLPDAVAELLEEAAVPVACADPDGVQVLALDRCRGQDFDEIYVLGFNRGVVPRRAAATPHHGPDDIDAMRDGFAAARAELPEALRDGLLPLPARAEDDALAQLDNAESLFGRARRRLTFSFLRATTQGQPKTASPWLRRLRGVTACDNAVQLPSETDALMLAASSGGAVALSACAERLRPEWADTCAAARDWLEHRDSFHTSAAGALRLDPIDLGAPATGDRGWSVSAFEDLGTCPLLFWFRHVLRVRPLPDEPLADEISRRHVGIAVHKMLQRVFTRLVESGALDRTLEERARTARDLLASELRGYRESLLPSHARRLPLLRERLLASWESALGTILDLDLADLDANAMRPDVFEHVIEGCLELGFTQRSRVALHGRADRIDAGESGSRIIDYKTGGRFDPENAEILNEPFKGRRLQLPLYAMLLGAAGDVLPCAELRGVSPEQLGQFRGDLPRRYLSPKVFSPGLLETLGVLADLLAAGSFPFRKGPPCGWCQYRAACPRNHPPTAARHARIESLEAFDLLPRKTQRRPTLEAVKASRR